MTKVEKLLLISGVILLLLLTGYRALADSPGHWPIGKGEASPEAGQCMTVERALAIGLKAEQCDKRIEIELDRCREKSANALELDRRRKAIDSERQQTINDLLRKRAEAAEAWYRSPAFVATVAAILTTGLLLGARALLVETQPNAALH